MVIVNRRALKNIPVQWNSDAEFWLKTKKSLAICTSTTLDIVDLLYILISLLFAVLVGSSSCVVSSFGFDAVFVVVVVVVKRLLKGVWSELWW